MGKAFSTPSGNEFFCFMWWGWSSCLDCAKTSSGKCSFDNDKVPPNYGDFGFSD